MPEEQCKDCKFWYEEQGGTCRFQPPYPAVVPLPAVQEKGIIPFLTIWPMTQPGDVCSQFEMRVTLTT